MNMHNLEESMHHPCEHQKVAFWTKRIIVSSVTHSVSEVIEVILRELRRKTNCILVDRCKVLSGSGHIGKMRLSDGMKPSTKYSRSIDLQSILTEAEHENGV